MPELPEVEIFTMDLDRWCRGRRIEAVELVDPRLVAEDDHPRLAGLAGQRVDRVWRRAKWSLLEVGDLVVGLHYRMTGKPVLDDGDTARKVRLRLRMEGGTTVAFDDRRCLGRVVLVDKADWPTFEAGLDLGPDAWPGRRLGAWWKQRMGRGRRAIKPVLLEQARVAGIGNIGAAESCFRARIDPRTPAEQLSDPQWAALAQAVPDWVEHTLENELGNEIHFVTAGGDNPFLVYGREGEPCSRCGTAIERLKQAGRSTFWCPGCQAA